MQKKAKNVNIDNKLNPQPDPPSPAAKLERVGINPQSEPPKPSDKLQRVGLNPQPEPPSPASKLQKVGLNPQPEPPAPGKNAKLERTGLNPQPDPPMKNKKLERSGLNPQPEPPAQIGKFKAIKIVSLLGAIGLGVVGFYFLAMSLLPAMQVLQDTPPISGDYALAQAAVNAALIPTIATLIPAGALLVVGIAVKAH